jgi:hypothetical protein
MGADLVAFEQMGEWKMPDGLALSSDDIDFILKVKVVFASKLLDCIGGELPKLMNVNERLVPNRTIR